MKNYIIGLLLCLLLPVCPAVAAETLADINAVQTGENTVQIELSFEDSEEPVDFIIQVFAPGKSQADLVSGKPVDNVSVMVWNKQGVTDADGRFAAEFGINGSAGEYTVRLYNGKDKKTVNNAATFWFTDKESLKTLMDELNAAAKAGTAEAFIRENKSKLTIFDTENISEGTLADIIEAEVKSEEFDSESFDACKDRAEIINLIGLLNESKAENVFTYTEALEQIEEYVDFAKKNKYFETDSRAADVSKRLSGKNIKDAEDFEEKLAEAMILVIAEKPDGNDNIEEAVQELGDLAGVDTDGASSEKIYSVCGKKYDTIEAFNKAVQKANSDSGKGGSSGGGGGSGGGGSSGGVTKGKISNADEIIKREEIQSIPSDVFTDLEDAIWARNAIVSLTDLGYLRGRAEGIFAPNENILREEFVKILVYAFDDGTEIDESAKLSFKDSDENAWYYPYLVKAVNCGIVKGYSDEVFGVGECITRQDMAVMIYRAMATAEVAAEDYSEQFSDFGDVDEYAVDAISYFVEKGIINGMGDGSLQPGRYTTRAEAAKVIYEVIRQ